MIESVNRSFVSLLLKTCVEWAIDFVALLKSWISESRREFFNIHQCSTLMKIGLDCLLALSGCKHRDK